MSAPQSLARLSWCCIVASTATASAQPAPCTNAHEYLQRCQVAATAPTPAQASVDSDRLLGDLHADPSGPCADVLRRALLDSLVRSGRMVEAMTVAEDGSRDSRWFSARAMCANNAISLRLDIEGRPLSASSMAQCRRLAEQVLHGQPSFLERLASDSLGMALSDELVLYHVLATTEATPAAEVIALKNLVAFTRAAAARLPAPSQPPNLDFELETFITELLNKQLASEQAPTHDEIVDLLSAIPRQLGKEHACSTVLHASQLPHQQKVLLLDAMASQVDPLWSVAKRYDLLKRRIKSDNPEADPVIARDILNEADSIWHQLLAARNDPPAPDAFHPPKAVNALDKPLLHDRCWLGVKVLKDPAYVPVAEEFAARFPESAPRVRLWLGQSGN